MCVRVYVCLSSTLVCKQVLRQHPLCVRWILQIVELIRVTCSLESPASLVQSLKSKILFMMFVQINNYFHLYKLFSPRLNGRTNV